MKPQKPWGFKQNSGNGVFYQAIPAVGADGKNIMKLIPVQMINGQFFVQKPICKHRMDSAAQRAVNVSSAPVQMVKAAAMKPSATQQSVRKQVSFVNALPNQAALDRGNSLNKHPPQQQTVNSVAKAPPIATPATNCGKSVKFACQVPVTVQSPVLPRGQSLQIPPNAQVRTVPASELPPVIKEQIFNSSANSPPGSGLPSVVYVSPVTTVNQRLTPPCDSALQSLQVLSNTPNKPSCGPPAKGSKPFLKLIPKVSQRPNSPVKWVIEDEDSSTSPNRTPLCSHSVASEILRAEDTSEDCDVIKNNVSRSSQGTGGSGQENALVVCNGKVFFVGKKRNLPFEMGKSNTATAATESCQFSKTIVSSTEHSVRSGVAQTRQDLRIIIPDESDEVIDLCDDDAQDDSSRKAASVNTSAASHQDDDNVIFVSYIPPKSEAASTHDLILKTQMALEEGTDQAGTGSSYAVTEEKSPHGGRSGGDGRDEQGEGMDADVGTGSPSDPSTSDSSSGTCSQKQQDTHKMESSCWTFSLARKPCQMTDHLLRKIFGITSDVKICLQRIDDASPGSFPAEPLKTESLSSSEDHQGPVNALKEQELFFQDLYRSSNKQKNDAYNSLINVQRVKAIFEQKPSADPTTPAPYTDTALLKCALFKLKTKPVSALKNRCHSGQSLLQGASCDVENTPVTGYVEPIDEDFPSADADDIPESENSTAQLQTQTCVDLSTNRRRIGRTRKRTMCPCCIPGSLEPAVKSSMRLDVPAKWPWLKKQMSKKGGQTKPPRKHGEPPGIGCLTARNRQRCKTYEVPASDTLSPPSPDTDEPKRHKLRASVRERDGKQHELRQEIQHF